MSGRDPVFIVYLVLWINVQNWRMSKVIDSLGDRRFALQRDAWDYSPFPLDISRLYMLGMGSVENNPLVSLPFLSLFLLQKEHTDPGDHVRHYARVNGKCNIDREQLSTKKRGDHSTSKNGLPQTDQFSDGDDERRTHTLDNAEAIPIAEPLTFVVKTSGVHPYKIAHIADEAKEAPTVLALNNRGPSALANTKQKKPLRKVLPAKDHLRPRDDSTR